MPYEVRATVIANRQIEELRGPRRKAYLAFEHQLASSGCRALDYRLSGASPLPSICVKHLRAADRAVVAFSQDRAWVLLVGPHDRGDHAADVYASLYALLDLSAPEQPRTKPPCCDGADQSPTLAEADIDSLVDEARRLRL